MPEITAAPTTSQMQMLSLPLHGLQNRSARSGYFVVLRALGVRKLKKYYLPRLNFKPFSHESLKVFVSGKEEEVGEERLIIINEIDKLGLRPIASELRGATDEPIRPTFLKEVRESDLYIRILGSRYSARARDFE